MIRRSIRRALARTPLFHIVYSWYLFTFRRSYWRKISADREYFRKFVHKGALVFDIGANVGEMSRCFLSLGVRRVIAVEPVPWCLEHLREIRGSVTESEVLDGLTTLPCPLSFEFNSEWRDAIEICLAKSCLANARFNFGVGSRMVLPHWVDRSELLRSLEGVAGDIFASPCNL